AITDRIRPLSTLKRITRLGGGGLVVPTTGREHHHGRRRTARRPPSAPGLGERQGRKGWVLRSRGLSLGQRGRRCRFGTAGSARARLFRSRSPGAASLHAGTYQSM